MINWIKCKLGLHYWIELPAKHAKMICAWCPKEKPMKKEVIFRDNRR
jgi:hypothetical protein